MINKATWGYKDISTYRSELMGWAILWIMMLHFDFNQIKPLGFIAQYGYAGVEIFILVSGFGVFFSLEKDNSIIRFYKKRLLRIFPTYYLLGIIASLLLFHDSILSYLFRYSTIGFWTGGIYWEWYIPSIVMLYIIAPVLKQFFDRKLFVLLCTIAFAILFLVYYIIDKDIVDRAHFFFFYRIPAFIFGMACAYWLKHSVSNKYYILILIIGIPLFAILFPQHHQVYNYKNFSFLFLLPTTTFVFILISKYIHFLSPIMALMGKASLEIYLIQSMFYHQINSSHIVIPSLWHDTITIALIVLCSILGIIVHWLIDKSGILRFF